MEGKDFQIDIFSETKDCDYKDRHYSVRDNGAIYRHHKTDHKPSKLDDIWTFGNKDAKSGYMLYGGIRVHQVVATAFHGQPESDQMVVDHKDTNRCNNRPENLSWVTRLENVLNNPITRNRIIFYCGSVEAFLKDPSILNKRKIPSNLDWMRTVSKEEASKCLKNLSRWTEMDKQSYSPTYQPKGISESVFSGNDSEPNEFGETWDKDWSKSSVWPVPSSPSREELAEAMIAREEKALERKDSLTDLALQEHWKVPSEFPLCPKSISKTPLKDYLKNLKPGEIFCTNNTYESSVYKAELNQKEDLIAVWTNTLTSPVTKFALTEITFEDRHFIHKSIRTFFTEEGAEKYFTLSLSKEWTGDEVMEDYC